MHIYVYIWVRVCVYVCVSIRVCTIDTYIYKYTYFYKKFIYGCLVVDITRSTYEFMNVTYKVRYADGDIFANEQPLNIRINIWIRLVWKDGREGGGEKKRRGEKGRGRDGNASM